MHHLSQAAVVANDLNSLAHRIEALPPHPDYSRAVSAVQAAEAAVRAASTELHHRAMAERFAKADAV